MDQQKPTRQQVVISAYDKYVENLSWEQFVNYLAQAKEPVRKEVLSSFRSDFYYKEMAFLVPNQVDEVLWQKAEQYAKDHPEEWSE